MMEWHIQSRAHECQHCQTPFQDKQAYRTVLFEERQGYARLDVCEPCWGKGFAALLDGRATRQISQWQGIYVPPPAVPPDPIQKESAEGLLRKLVELKDPAHAPSCYILAAMLERKRILKVKEQLKHEGNRVFLYEHTKTGDLFAITDPKLQLNQLEAVQHAVATLLERGLDVPAPATPAAATETASSTEQAPATTAANPETPAPEAPQAEAATAPAEGASESTPAAS